MKNIKNYTTKKEYDLYRGESFELHTCKKCKRQFQAVTNYCSQCGNKFETKVYRLPFTFHSDIQSDEVFTRMDDAEELIYAYYAMDYNNVDVSQDDELYEQYCDYLYAKDADGEVISYQEYYDLSPDEVDEW